jgi:hypothetical protein
LYARACRRASNAFGYQRHCSCARAPRRDQRPCSKQGRWYRQIPQKFKAIHKMSAFVKQTAFKFQLIFVGLFILSVPFKHGVLPNWGSFFNPLTEGLTQWIGDKILGLQHTYTAALMSDSTGFYVYSGFLMLFALQIALVWQAVRPKQLKESIKYWFSVLMSYYLSLHLMAYGTSKIFKVQFFLPEPNTLYTPLGELSPDILFWSTMGSAYGYTVFSGLLEIIPALLLLFRKTRALGALIAMAVMTNVVAINFGFDISVKLFSSFLLLLSILILLPYFKVFYQFFILQKVSQLHAPKVDLPKKYYLSSKFILLSLIVLNAFLPYIQTQNFNDDTASRPFLHGAYLVEDFNWDHQKIDACLDEKTRWHRIFIHRRGYFIIQNMQGKFQDFKLSVSNNQLLLTDYQNQEHKLHFEYNQQQELSLNGKINGYLVKLNATSLDWEALPLIKAPFHWTIDDI